MKPSKHISTLVGVAIAASAAFFAAPAHADADFDANQATDTPLGPVNDVTLGQFNSLPPLMITNQGAKEAMDLNPEIQVSGNCSTIARRNCPLPSRALHAEPSMQIGYSAQHGPDSLWEIRTSPENLGSVQVRLHGTNLCLAHNGISDVRLAGCTSPNDLTLWNFAPRPGGGISLRKAGTDKCLAFLPQSSSLRVISRRMSMAACNPNAANQSLTFVEPGFSAITNAPGSDAVSLADPVAGYHKFGDVNSAGVHEYQGGVGPSNLIATSAKASRTFVGKKGGTAIDMFDATTGQSLAVIPIPGGVADLSVSPDGSLLLVPNSDDDRVNVIDTSTGKSREYRFSPDDAKLASHVAGFTTGAFVSDTQALLATRDSDQLVVLDLAVRSFFNSGIQESGVKRIVKSGAGAAVVSAGSIATADLDASKVGTWYKWSKRTQFPRSAGEPSIASSADGTRLFIAYSDSSELDLLDRGTLNVTAQVKLRAHPSGIAIGSDPDVALVSYIDSGSVDRIRVVARAGRQFGQADPAPLVVNPAPKLNTFRELAAISALQDCQTTMSRYGCTFRMGQGTVTTLPSVCKQSYFNSGTTPLAYGSVSYSLRRSYSTLTGTTKTETSDNQFGVALDSVSHDKNTHKWARLRNYVGLTLHGEYSYAWGNAVASSEQRSGSNDATDTVTIPAAQAQPGQFSWIYLVEHVTTYSNAYALFFPGTPLQFSYPLPQFQRMNENSLPVYQVGANEDPGSDNPCFSSQVIEKVAKPVRVSFDPNGASGKKPDDLVYNSAVRGIPALTLPNADHLAFPGQHLDSWNSRPDGTGQRYEIYQRIRPEAAMTLYAQWVLGAPPAPTEPKRSLVPSGGHADAAAIAANNQAAQQELARRNVQGTLRLGSNRGGGDGDELVGHHIESLMHTGSSPGLSPRRGNANSPDNQESRGSDDGDPRNGGGRVVPPDPHANIPYGADDSLAPGHQGPSDLDVANEPSRNALPQSRV